MSVLFALALTVTGVLLGMATGAIQGFFGGKTDLAFQRFIEIWGSMPELYLLIIFSAVLAPSIGLLLVLLSLFGWMGLSDYVRAEFLRNRQLDYVKAARALGVGNGQIIWRHILPNSLRGRRRWASCSVRGRTTLMRGGFRSPRLLCW